MGERTGVRPGPCAAPVPWPLQRRRPPATATVIPPQPALPPVRGVTISSLLKSGQLPWHTSAAVRTAMHRSRRKGTGPPKVLGLARSGEKLYDAVAFADWAELVKPGRD